MSRMEDVTRKFLTGLNENVETLIDRSTTYDQLYDILKILYECRSKLLEYEFGMIVGEGENNGR